MAIDHIWFYAYTVEFCVNCPAVRIERVGDAGDPEPTRDTLRADIKESEV